MTNFSVWDAIAIASEPTAADWAERALCAQIGDVDLFYPEKGGSTKGAKAVCAGCEVREQCLEDALDNDDRHGIWGGYSERERREIKRRRGSVAA